MSVTHEEVRDMETNGVKAPNLERLMSSKCTKAELQAALVQLIHIVNMNQIEYQKWATQVEATLKNKSDRPWRASM
jgi:hypothetical protein